MNNKTTLYAHNDLDVLATAKNRFGTNFIIGEFTECYIMQENKIVFIGNKKKGIEFIENNEGLVLNGL
jgi:hypothetical protein